MPLQKMPYVPFVERPEWSDLQPVPQDDIPGALAAISYKPEYVDAMNYFRAIVAKGELSKRVLDLTTAIVEMNPASYPVWLYRSKAAIATQADLDAELDFIDKIIKQNLKVYQTWQYRKILVDTSGRSNREIPFITRMLALDAKNYHTWQYRQWVLCRFDDRAQWKAELSFVEDLLDDDVRNNSAWNHRFFVAIESGRDSLDREAVFSRETEYACQKIKLAPNNPSAWSYLRGTLKRAERPLSSLESFVESVLEAKVPGSDGKPPILAIEFLAETMAESAQGKDSNDSSLRKAKAVELYNELVQLDPIRKSYWHHCTTLIAA